MIFSSRRYECYVVIAQYLALTFRVFEVTYLDDDVLTTLFTETSPHIFSNTCACVCVCLYICVCACPPQWTKTLYVTRSDDATLENVLNIETDEALRELLEEERSFPGKFAIRLEQCKNEKYSRFRREIPQASTTSCSSSVSSGSSAHENAITGKQHPSSAGLSKVRQGGRRSVCRLALQQQGHHCIRPSSSKAGRKTKGPSSASGDDRCFDGPTISHASCGAASREVAATTSAPTGPYFLPGRAVQNGQPFFGEPEGVDGQFYASHGNFYMQNQQGFSGPSGVYPHVGPVILYCPQPMHPLNGYAYPPYPFY